MNQVKAGAVLNYVIVGLNILTGLLYTPFMLRCLGQNEYGLYSLVASVIAYLTLLDFGFGSAIVRYTAKIRATGSRNEEWSLYGMFLSSYSIIGLLVTAAGIVIYFNMDQMFDRTMNPEEMSQARIMMALMVANLAVTFPLSVFGSIITAYEKFVFQRTINILRILLSTAVLIAVLLMGYKAVALVVVQTVFSIGTLLINLIYCLSKLKIKIYFNDFNFLLLKEIMIFSWWNFVGAIVDRIYWSTGQFILGIYSGTVAVAIYSLAITMMHLYMSLSTSLNSVLLPRITVLATSKENDKKISDLFIKTGRLQFCVIALVLSGFTVFGLDFIRLWAGPDYKMSYFVAIIFFYSITIPLIQNVGLSIMMARGQMKFRAVTYLFISLGSLLLQLILVKKYDVIGCATAIAIAHVIGQWIIMNLYYWKKQRIEIYSFWCNIIKMSYIPIFLTVAGIVIISHINIENWGMLCFYGLLFILLYLPAFWKFSMNEYEKNQIKKPAVRLLSAIR